MDVTRSSVVAASIGANAPVQLFTPRFWTVSGCNLKRPETSLRLVMGSLRQQVGERRREAQLRHHLLQHCIDVWRRCRAYQRIRTVAGMPSVVIRLSTLHSIFTSVC
jgi:hypothetical protein